MWELLFIKRMPLSSYSSIVERVASSKGSPEALRGNCDPFSSCMTIETTTLLRGGFCNTEICNVSIIQQEVDQN